MRAIFSEDRRIQRLLQVEAALSEAHASLGHIPQEAARAIAATVREERVPLERVTPATVSREWSSSAYRVAATYS